MPSPEPLTSEELAALDAQYRPIPAFSNWPQVVEHPDHWHSELNALRDLRDDVSEEDLKRSIEVAMRAAAFETGAIEGLYTTDRGLTRTVATQAAAWEEQVRKSGASALELFNAQLAAYELVMDVATRAIPVSEAWIRRLHEELTSAQETYVVQTPLGPQEQPLPRGEYKSHPNHVQTRDGTAHSYAPVDLTRPEMGRLVEQLESDPFRTAHPVLQASYAHYAFVAVHPFADGNGRVARALASVYLYRAAWIPLLIFADQRTDYFNVLSLADTGSCAPFAHFVEQCALSAIAMVSETLRAAMAPKPEEIVARFQGLFIAQGDLTHKQIDEVAARLAEDVANALVARVAELGLPDGITIGGGVGSGTPGSPPKGFRHIVHGGGKYVVLDVASAAPAQARDQLQIPVFVSTDQDDTLTFRVDAVSGAASPAGLTFGLRDVYPELSVAAHQRICAFVERILGSELQAVHSQAEASLRGSGFAG
jgi:Fic family protein